MQIELFDPSSTGPPDRAKTGGPMGKRAKRTPAERTVVAAALRIDTWVSYPARTVNAEDGLRVEFSVPVSLDLQTWVGVEKREIGCKYRVRKGFAWGGLGRGARVVMEADLCRGPRGGYYLHCKDVAIVEPHPLKGEMLSKSMMRQLEKKAIQPTPA